MNFIKPVTIYENKNTLIYINQCHNKGKKTKLFAVRKNDRTGIGYLLGTIKFDGGWRQYILFPEPNTKWSSSCKKAIADFEEKQTKKWRKNLRK